jgi:hypothetical protein
MASKAFPPDPHPRLPFDVGVEAFKTDMRPGPPRFRDMRKEPRAIKVVLHSGNRVRGTLQAAEFDVRLPVNNDFQSDKLIMVVESLVHATGPNNNANIDAFPTYVSIQEFRNPFSWDSRTNGPHGIVAVTGSRNFQNASQKDLGGATLVDRTLFDRPITIVFASPNYVVTAAGGVSNDWTLVLSLWDAGEA